MPESKMLTVRQVAEQLACSDDHVYWLINAQQLKSVNVSRAGRRGKYRRHRIRQHDLDVFLRSREVRVR